MDGSAARQHYPALDGVRGIAALGVVFAHFHALFGIVNSQVGVDVFFVLSGFLITRLLNDELQQTGSIRFGRFYLRRALRLMPALVLMVGFFVLVAIVRQHDLEATFAAAGAALTYTTNWFRALRFGDGGEFANTWTLAIEEQFYLTLPLVLLLLAPRLAKIGRLVFFAVLAIAIYVHRADLIAASAQAPGWIYYAFHTRADSLIVGVIAALALDLRGRRPLTARGDRMLLAGAIFGCSAIFFAMIFRTPYEVYLQFVEPFVTIGTALLLLHLVGGKDSVIRRALSITPLTRVGTVSYGLYLWHYPILIVFASLAAPLELSALGYQAVSLFILLPLSFAGCVLSYRYVERPFLALKDRVGSARTPAGGTIAAARPAG